MSAWTSPLLYFSDPILRAPTIGCMLMCLSASVVGVLTLLKKQSLVGETLSHAAFPGTMCGILVTGFFFAGDPDSWAPIWTIAGSFLAALLGLFCVHFFETRMRIRMDSALTCVLALFFGLGVTLASRIQFSYTSLYQQALSYLYGQAATMTDEHVFLYGSLCFGITLLIVLFYKELQTVLFDASYANSLGMKVSFMQGLILFVSTLAVVIGIRSVGVVLMSAMLIAPAVTARQFTHRLYWMFFISAIIGLMSGFLGVYLSMEISQQIMEKEPQIRFSLPTGPMIVIVATFFCFMALLCAPQSGLLFRVFRRFRFRHRCLVENLLKQIWRADHPLNREELTRGDQVSSLYLSFLLRSLLHHGWIQRGTSGVYMLTEDGIKRAESIVRRHRLWELYLSRYLGMGVDRVHRSAEEMEHILTPDIERELDRLLQNPTVDPHDQPIPRPIHWPKMEEKR